MPGVCLSCWLAIEDGLPVLLSAELYFYSESDQITLCVFGHSRSFGCRLRISARFFC